MTRRSLIQRALLIVGIDPARLVGWSAGRTTGANARPVRVVLDGPADGGTLSAIEMEDLVAFGEVLVEGRTLAPVERSLLVEHIKDRTELTSGYLSLYRTTAWLLERLAGRQFASLEVDERVEFVARYRLGVSRVRPGEALGPFPTEMRTLRTRAVPDLIRGYYASPAGWVAVGYAAFPGRCGNLTRYTRPES